jgi:hypothetical protein
MLLRRIDFKRLYTVYLTAEKDGDTKFWIEAIDGLMTNEESTVAITERKAEEEAVKEAGHKAKEKANRYDPAVLL